MAATSRQYQAVKQGGPFAFASIPKPTPGPNEVSVRIKAIGLNPVDCKRLQYGVMVQSWPAVFGIDGAGTVEAVGDGVTSVKPGDEVMAMCTGKDGSAFQEIAVVSQAYVSKKPKSLNFEEAASLPVCYLTAACCIYEHLKIPLPFLQGGESNGPKPNSILILGGSSAVGAAAIQLLRLALPSTTIVATSSPQHHAHLNSLGASKCFDQKSANLVADIRSTSPGGNGVDMIIDAVASGASQTNIWEALSAGGPRKYAQVMTGAQFEVPADVHRTNVFGPSVFGQPGGANLMPALTQLIDEGKYRLPVRVKSVGNGFEAIPKGLEELGPGVSGTKLTLSV